MLNIFPIQFLAPVAYLILRVCIGTLFIQFGMSRIRMRTTLSEPSHDSRSLYTKYTTLSLALIEIAIGTFFIIGLYTQIAAICGMIYSLTSIMTYTHLEHLRISERKFFSLLFVISLSLFITGAGLFAFDLPL